jgi:DNA-binding transcriptional MerR regulator
LNKAPDAFRTISEVADELDLPQHVLRFWESRFPHIRPMKRGGGRRYYRPEDVDLLRGIRHLLYGDGYTIRGVQRILREQGVRTVQSVGQGHAVNLVASPHDDTRDGDDGGGAEGSRGLLKFLPRFAGSDAGPGAGASVGRSAGAAADNEAAPCEEEDDVELRDHDEDQEQDLDRDEGQHAAAPASPALARPKRPDLEPRIAPQSPPDGVRAKAEASAPVDQPARSAANAAKKIAAEDLDRLKHALAELESCRRLLDRANEDK